MTSQALTPTAHPKGPPSEALLPIAQSHRRSVTGSSLSPLWLEVAQVIAEVEALAGTRPTADLVDGAAGGRPG
jgi:hypothetical protein